MRTMLGRGAVLALYAGLVAWLTWPLAASLGTHLPFTVDACRSDPLHLAWVLAYESHRLVTAPWALFEANIFHPTAHALFYGEEALGALPYFLPTFLLTGNPTLALNLMLLGSMALTAWSLHLLVLHWTRSHLAGLVAAWTFLSTRWVSWLWFPVAPQYAVVQYLPLLMLWTADPTVQGGRALRLLPLLVLQGLTTPYMAVAVLGIVGLLGMVRLCRRSTRRGGAHLLAVACAAGLILLGAYAGQLGLRLTDPDLTRRTWWPSAGEEETVLPWGMFSPMKSTGIPSAAFLLIAVGAVCALVRGTPDARTAWRQGAFWAAGGIVLSLTPTVLWGESSFRLPQAFLPRWLPIYELIREPVRLGVVGLVGLSVLVGVGFAECARAVRAPGGRPAEAVVRGALAALVLWVFHFQYATGLGMPSSPYHDLTLPPAYRLQAAAPPGPDVLRVLRAGQGALLELPVPAARGEASAAPQALALFHSIYHWRPVLNGYASYWPPGFHERMEVARLLPRADAVAALRAEAGLELVLVHTGSLAEGPQATWRGLAESGGRSDLRLVAREGDDLLFMVGKDDPAADSS